MVTAHADMPPLIPHGKQLMKGFKRQRIKTSCNVVFNACPKCRAPVTFGGGITIVYGFLLGSGSE